LHIYLRNPTLKKKHSARTGENESMSRRKGTKTSRFGVSKRESHDSAAFYGSRMYEGSKIDEKLPEIDNTISPEVFDKVLCQDSRKMDNLPESSLHLMVTSPPYNVGKEYDANLNLKEYFALLKDVFAETYRVLVNGGRACVNIANVGRKPYIPYHKFIIDTMLDVGFLMRGEVIWDKGAGAGVSTAWGSWQSAANPTLRDIHEYILVFSKGKFSRAGRGRENTISREEFLGFTKSIWTFPPESARQVGHPAPFPVELPYRCIQLYTFKGEVVLDPFAGVATTAIAALRTGRHYVCFDNNPEYVAGARRRIREYLADQTKIVDYAAEQAPASRDPPISGTH
jgi:site-specific DNA-methyltransferase (adenine-specific)